MASRFNVSGVLDLLEDDDFGLSGGDDSKAMGSVATFLRWTRVFLKKMERMKYAMKKER